MLHWAIGWSLVPKTNISGFDSCMEHNMKPYNLGKKLSSGTTSFSGSWKTDYHLHTKKGRKIENWWEGMVHFVSRRTVKQDIKRQLDSDEY